MNQFINTNYDVCICGGGIAGLVTAYALGKSGRKVLVVEKNETFNPNGADVLKPSGIEVLESLGLYTALLNNGAIKRDKVLVYYGGHLVSEIDYKQEHKRNYFMLIPYRNVLNMMLSVIKDIENIHLLFSTELTSANIDECSGDVTEVLLNGRIAVRAKVFIAADGIMSKLRSLLAVPAVMEKYSQKMYFAHFPRVDSVAFCNRLYIDRNHTLGYFYPVGKDHFRCVIGLSNNEGDEYFVHQKKAELLRNRLYKFVTHSDDAIEAITSLDKFVTFPLCKMNLNSYHKGNVVFVGNSAHSIHPVTGQGMNLAIEDAGTLFPLLESFFNGLYGLPEAFYNYQNLRHHVNEKVVNYGHSLVNSFDSKETFVSNLNPHLQTSNRNI